MPLNEPAIPSCLATRISVITVAVVWLDWSQMQVVPIPSSDFFPTYFYAFMLKDIRSDFFWLTASQAHVLLGASACARHSTFPYFLKRLCGLCFFDDVGGEVGPVQPSHLTVLTAGVWAWAITINFHYSLIPCAQDLLEILLALLENAISTTRATHSTQILWDRFEAGNTHIT